MNAANNHAPHIELHRQILSLQCDSSRYDAEPNQRLAFKEGHRDARHAAAVLANAFQHSLEHSKEHGSACHFDLHAEIMRLPCSYTPNKNTDLLPMQHHTGGHDESLNLAYKEGHKAARHAAAELASAYVALSELPLDTRRLDVLIDWFLRGGERSEIAPNGHITPTKREDVLVWLDSQLKPQVNPDVEKLAQALLDLTAATMGMVSTSNRLVRVEIQSHPQYQRALELIAKHAEVGEWPDAVSEIASVLCELCIVARAYDVADCHALENACSLVEFYFSSKVVDR